MFNENIKKNNQVIKREFISIKPERILNIAELGLTEIAADEIFVDSSEFENLWVSNYGRVIQKQENTYKLLSPIKREDGVLEYYFKIELDGKFRWKRKRASRFVVEEFIVNPVSDRRYVVWHADNDKGNDYYRNLYPLSSRIYKAVNLSYKENGYVSEEEILAMINNESYLPLLCNIGFYGTDKVDHNADAFIRWVNMLDRCYNDSALKIRPKYRVCSVCEEWHNFSNFEKWYKENFYQVRGARMSLDKDILVQGNTVYSPDTCCFVPECINTLFSGGGIKKDGLPIGVTMKTSGEYYVSILDKNRRIKYGPFSTVEDAHKRYKEMKEKQIKLTAKKYKNEIPAKVYDAMIAWKI